MKFSDLWNKIQSSFFFQEFKVRFDNYSGLSAEFEETIHLWKKKKKPSKRITSVASLQEVIGDSFALDLCGKYKNEVYYYDYCGLESWNSNDFEEYIALLWFKIRIELLSSLSSL